jgi:hypothetical protein
MIIHSVVKNKKKNLNALKIIRFQISMGKWLEFLLFAVLSGMQRKKRH